MQILSVIVPVYQNKENLPSTIPKLLSLMELLKEYTFEFVFVDDGSTDGSIEELIDYHHKYPDLIKIVRLTKNFGQTPAIQAGLRHCEGEGVIIISADLQEPYEKIIDMVRAWKRGSKFVIGERKERKETLFHQTISKSYWKMVRNFGIKDFPSMGFDFCFLDRQIVSEINQINEKNTSIFPLIFWLGYKPTFVEITRTLRSAGKSQWGWLKKFRITLDTLIAFTHIPVRFITVMAFFTTIFAIFFMIHVLIMWFVYNNPVMGFTTIVGLILIFGSLSLFSLGIIAEYIWRILDETRKRPPFIIDEIIGPKD